MSEILLAAGIALPGGAAILAATVQLLRRRKAEQEARDRAYAALRGTLELVDDRYRRAVRYQAPHAVESAKLQPSIWSEEDRIIFNLDDLEAFIEQTDRELAGGEPTV